MTWISESRGAGFQPALSIDLSIHGQVENLPHMLSLANNVGCACHENSTVFGEPGRLAETVLKKMTDSRNFR